MFIPASVAAVVAAAKKNAHSLTLSAFACLSPQLSPHFAPRAFVRSVVILVRNPKDLLRRACLSTLRKWTLGGLTTRLVVQCGGLAAMAEAALDLNCKDIMPSILLTLIHVTQDPRTRHMVDPWRWMQHLIGALTGKSGAFEVHVAKLGRTTA